LPLRRIERAQIRNKIVLEEHPTLSRFCAGKYASTRTPANLLRVHLEEVRGLRQRE